MADEMEVVEDLNSGLDSKLTQCEVCGASEAKYTCPRCEVRTCSLQCVNIHKKELECSALRDKVKFKRLKQFDNIDLLNDYRLLEETARVVSKPVKLPAKSCYNEKTGGLPLDLYRLRCAAQRRGVQLHFLPPTFTRRGLNTTRLDHQSQTLSWRVEWVFPQADHLTLTDDEVVDSKQLSACVHKWLDPEYSSQPSLVFYQAAGHAGIRMLLRANKTPHSRYYLLDSATTLRDNLSGKCIIEYPVILVILSHHVHMYNVLSPEEEDDIARRQRRRNQVRTRHNNRPNNFLFPSSDGTNDSRMEENMSITSENADQTEIKGDEEFQTRGRGMRGRWRGRGRGRGRGRFHHRGGNRQDRSQQDFSVENINTSLLSNFNAVNLQASASPSNHHQ